MEVVVDTTQLKMLELSLAKAGKKTPALVKKALSLAGDAVYGRAFEFAPRSMTKAEYVSTLDQGYTERKTSSFTSGQLKASIKKELFNDRVEIGVPSNSKANKYAEKMHDEHGKTWKYLGWQNDSKATHKYIYKAYDASERDINKVVSNLMDSIVRVI